MKKSISRESLVGFDVVKTTMAILAVLSGVTVFLSDYNWLVKYSFVLSSYISPVLISIALLVLVIKHPKDVWACISTNKHFFYATLITYFAVAVSYFVGESDSVKDFFANINFVIVSLFIAIALMHSSFSGGLIKLIGWSLFGWIAIPLFAMLSPSTQDYVIFFPCDLHGLSDSRLVFGFWCGVGLILFGNTQQNLLGTYKNGFALAVIWGCLVLSGTRSAALALIVGAGVALIGHRIKIGKVLFYFAFFAAAGVIFLQTWGYVCVNGEGYKKGVAASNSAAIFNLYVRPGITTMQDPARWEIYSKYWMGIKDKWLFGYGEMHLIDLPELGRSGVQAHNLFIQFLSNYGVVALASLVYWLISFFMLLRTQRARMLFVYVITFSLFQPLVGGSANLFSPFSLLLFLLVVVINGTNGQRSGFEQENKPIGYSGSGDAAIIKRPQII
jgi:hypothetical protein